MSTPTRKDGSSNNEDTENDAFSSTQYQKVAEEIELKEKRILKVQNNRETPKCIELPNVVQNADVIKRKFQDFSNTFMQFIRLKKKDSWILKIGQKTFVSNHTMLGSKENEDKFGYFAILNCRHSLVPFDLVNLQNYLSKFDSSSVAIRSFQFMGTKNEDRFVLLKEVVDILRVVCKGRERQLKKAFEQFSFPTEDHIHPTISFDQLDKLMEILNIDEGKITVIRDFHQVWTLAKSNKEFFTPISTLDSAKEDLISVGQAMMLTFKQVVVGIRWSNIWISNPMELARFKDKFFRVMETYEQMKHTYFVSKAFVEKNIAELQHDQLLNHLRKETISCFKDGQDMDTLRDPDFELENSDFNFPTALPMPSGQKVRLPIIWLSITNSWIDYFYLHEKPSHKLTLMKESFHKYSTNNDEKSLHYLEGMAHHWTEKMTRGYRSFWVDALSNSKIRMDNLEEKENEKEKEALEKSKHITVRVGEASKHARIEAKPSKSKSSEDSTTVIKLETPASHKKNDDASAYSKNDQTWQIESSYCKKLKRRIYTSQESKQVKTPFGAIFVSNPIHGPTGSIGSQEVLEPHNSENSLLKKGSEVSKIEESEKKEYVTPISNEQSNSFQKLDDEQQNGFALINLDNSGKENNDNKKDDGRSAEHESKVPKNTVDDNTNMECTLTAPP